MLDHSRSNIGCVLMVVMPKWVRPCLNGCARVCGTAGHGDLFSLGTTGAPSLNPSRWTGAGLKIQSGLSAWVDIKGLTGALNLDRTQVRHTAHNPS